MAETIKKEPEALSRFQSRSPVEKWAERGLGCSVTATEGFVELLSAYLFRLGEEIYTPELERWLDTYYQLRRQAEIEADMVKYMESGCRIAGKIEEVIPRPSAEENNKNVQRAVTEFLKFLFSPDADKGTADELKEDL